MYEFDHGAPVTVSLRAHRGEVVLVAEDRLTIQVEVEPLGNDEASHEAARTTRVALDGDTLAIHAPGGDTWSWRCYPKLRFTARVPQGSTLTGRSASADVRADGVWRVVQLELASAAAFVAEVTGDATIESASGDLTIERVGGALLAKSSSGDLRLGDVTSDVAARTASGDIRLRSADGRVSASTASGDIGIGELRRGTSVLRSASGDVEVGVAPGTSVWLDLDTASGKSISDLTAQGPARLPERATLELRVRTASGDIRVHRALTRGTTV